MEFAGNITTRVQWRPFGRGR